MHLLYYFIITTTTTTTHTTAAAAAITTVQYCTTTTTSRSTLIFYLSKSSKAKYSDANYQINLIQIKYIGISIKIYYKYQKQKYS